MSGSNAQKRTPVAQPEQAVVALIVEEGWIVGLATENEAGYNRLSYGPFETEKEARAKAYGVTPKRALMIVLSSMYPAPPEEHAKGKKAWPK